jgi:hypothetical protein
MQIKLQTEEDVLNYLEKYMEKLHVQHTIIFPEAAKTFLDIDNVKRTLRTNKVELFAKTMLSGKWRLINNGIAIDLNGDLVDGQHRMQAIVLADIPVEFYLHTGLEANVKTVIDTGTFRSLADSLKISGFGGHGSMTNIGAATRLLFMYETQPHMLPTMKKASNAFNVTHEEFVEFASALNKEKLFIAETLAQRIQKQNRGFNRSAMSALLYMALLKDTYEAHAFAERLITGVNLQPNDPELALRNQVIRIDARNSWHLLLYIKAWNARRAGRTMQFVRFREGEIVPTVK